MKKELTVNNNAAINPIRLLKSREPNANTVASQHTKYDRKTPNGKFAVTDFNPKMEQNIYIPIFASP